ncbi:MAG: hypothetical protein ABIT37_25045 [Luteolibacter sp.]
MAASLLASCASNKVPLVTTHSGKPPIRIYARTYWNDTGITLEKDRTYQLHITGTWTDWTYQATTAGPASLLVNALMFPFRPFLRYPPFRDPHANYFQAIGSIGRGEGKKLPTHAFIIRDSMDYTAPATGILHVFANDAPFAYENNSGHLTLTVSEM